MEVTIALWTIIVKWKDKEQIWKPSSMRPEMQEVGENGKTIFLVLLLPIKKNE